MNTKGKILITIIIILVLGAAIYAFYFWSGSLGTPKETATTTPQVTTPQTIEYRNNQFGFTFTLPASWVGFTASTTVWQGMTIAKSGTGEKLYATGTEIVLRHPLWTAETPRQDIPIMVFTSKQWSDLQNEKFHIGAAPIGPSVLASTTNFVFALPARYNYAFPIGTQEVEEIIGSKPLKTF